MTQPPRRHAGRRTLRARHAEVGRRHAGYYRVLAEQADRPLRSPGESHWPERLQAEAGNLAGAVRWYPGLTELLPSRERILGSEHPDTVTARGPHLLSPKGVQGRNKLTPGWFSSAEPGLWQKVRDGGRTVNVHALIAIGVNVGGKRILGLDRPGPGRP